MPITVPGADVPADVQRRLAEIDPRLHVRRIKTGYVDMSASGELHHNHPNDYKLSERWAVCMEWASDDPRRGMIQRGEMSPDSDFDLVGMIPPDCEVHAIPGHLVGSLNSTTPEKVRKAVAQWNMDQSLRNGRGVEDYMDEELDKLKIKTQPRSSRKG